MNETSTETSTKSMDEAFPPTAQEAANAYESASDDRAEGRTPADSDGRVAVPLGAVSSIPSGATALPDSSVPSETAPVDQTALMWDAGAGQPPILPDNSIPSEPLPSGPREEAPQPGTLPLPRMNLQNNFRLRMKVWTDPSTHKRYLMPLGFMRNLVNGQPVTDSMYAYAMSDTDTKIVMLTATEWNALPFFYFQEDGYAPRSSARPVDTLP